VSAAGRANQIEKLFFALLEQPRELRAAALLRECAGDDRLRQEVQRLLDADDSGAQLLEQPAYAPSARETPPAAFASGHEMGGFRIVRLVGSGGMGDVYEALQDQPRRTVALKVLRCGAASRDAVRRFQSESDVLARLSHPGIAQIFAVGIHQNGLFSAPYFAMEFIADAVDLMRYARERQLDLHSRLALFLDVCAAVQHGHQRGVIHRDLKPGNILVGSGGQPKVIDFGIAKAQDAGLPTTLATDIGQLVGTLQYMSPEQLRGDPAEIDTRSDVYSLGLILYELLAGRRPYDLSRLSLPEAVLRLQQADPPPLDSLQRNLRGDLTTIVAKSIEKARERRYQSAGELAADLERFQRNEPIVARPPGAIYLLRKFAWRHRAWTAAAAVSLLAIVGGAAAAGWQAVEATRERNTALTATRRAERINRFLMRVLSAADPRNSSADVTIRQALDAATESIATELAGDDLVAGDVHHMIASIYERLSQHDRAEVQMRKALEIRRQIRQCGLGETLRDLAWIVLARNPAEAAELFEQAEAEFQSYNGPDCVDAVQARVSIAFVRVNQQRYGEAETMVRAALSTLDRIGKSQGGTAMLAHRTLGMALLMQNRADEAGPHYEQAVLLARRAFGEDHLNVVATLTAKAGYLERVGRTDEAAVVRANAERIRSKLLGHAGNLAHP
jgi:tetratricopeptide (TPR) repeat protein